MSTVNKGTPRSYEKIAIQMVNHSFTVSKIIYICRVDLCAQSFFQYVIGGGIKKSCVVVLYKRCIYLYVILKLMYILKLILFINHLQIFPQCLLVICNDLFFVTYLIQFISQGSCKSICFI